MQKLTILFCFFLLTITLNAQNYNLIPNSSFEFYDQNVGCGISDTSFEGNKSCWITPNNHGSTCIGIPNFSNETPVNWPLPKADFKFIYFLQFFPGYSIDNEQFIDTTIDETHYDTIGINSRCYIETKLLTPLLAGVEYSFSLYVGTTKCSPEGPQIWMANFPFVPNIGAYFSVNKCSDYSTSGRIDVIPQLNFIDWDIPNDTFTYVNLKGKYTAQGGEEYLTIGNFDYYSEWNISFPDPYVYNGFVQPIFNALFLDSFTLTSDTINPIISPNYFELGKDTSICEGESITIGGEPNFYGYLWSTGDTSRFINVSETGTYYCTVDFGCSNYTDTIRVIVNATPQTFSLGADTSICNNDTMILSAPLGFNYLWSNGMQSQTIAVTEAGAYTCTISNACGTAQSGSIDIVVNYPPPIAQVLQGNLNICNNGELITTTLFTNSTYNLLWMDGSSNQSITVQTSGWYWLKESNECGVNIDSIYVIGCLGIESIPNVFSPNGDGLNETFKPIVQDIDEIETYNLKIYNRYGQLLFTSENSLLGWDGKTYHDGTYYFICTYKEKEKPYKTVSGNLEMLR